MNKFYFFILYLFFQLPLFNYIDAQNVDEQLWRSMIEEWAELNDSESVPDRQPNKSQRHILYSAIRIAFYYRASS